MDKDEFWAELDALGEEQVRENIGLGLYREKKEKFAKEWLRKKDQERLDERERSNDATNRESLDTAKSALTATRTSAVIAIIAIIVAVVIFLLQ